MRFKINIKDIAEKANVSTATVSNVINHRGRVGEETRKKIINIIEEFNYQPNEIAKNLKLNKTDSIGVIVEDISVFNAPEIIKGIHAAAEEKRLSILLTNMGLFSKNGNQFPDISKCKELAMPLYRQLVKSQVEGIIYIGIHPRDITDLISDSKIPIVYTYCYTRNKNDYSVNYDDEGGSYQLTKYLIDKGHSQIGLISGLINSTSTYARLRGYQKALSEHLLMFNPQFVKTGDWQYESGYRMTQDLLSQEIKPTAIIAMNDLMAAGAIQAINDSRFRVPVDISVLGFDNRELSGYLSPKLTTMSLPLEEMGKMAMDILDQIRKKHNVIQKKYLLDCQLVERDSVYSHK
ncbi:LacI family DNA-binding transcriptional regulator [uncultured Metabacillus sp.]|uniref:LacI family DNA-binding transcriptional regulator n=1 Tax=uncultured Metabacillus sp. TaxID=2860135 RepID=UPI002620FB82|nr:LacI family DNA-binding transcriptional regulator [uncultured Metabacillus sp.]